MATLNISLPDDLKTRMDRANANWSAIARRAFEIELDCTAATGGNMDAVIERLRASRRKIEEVERPAWIGKGRTWASDKAEIDQLEKTAMIEAGYFDRDRLLEEIAAARTHDIDEDDIRRIGSELSDGSKLPSVDQVRWFLEGVQQVWYEVKDKI